MISCLLKISWIRGDCNSVVFTRRYVNIPARCLLCIQCHCRTIDAGCALSGRYMKKINTPNAKHRGMEPSAWIKKRTYLQKRWKKGKNYSKIRISIMMKYIRALHIIYINCKRNCPKKGIFMPRAGSIDWQFYNPRVFSGSCSSTAQYPWCTVRCREQCLHLWG